MVLKIRKIEKVSSSDNLKSPKKTVKKSQCSAKPKAKPKKVVGEDKYSKYTDTPTRSINMDDVLIYFYEKYDGDWFEIYNAINRKERVNNEETIRFVDDKRKSYDYTTIIDDEYPIKYKLQDKPPFVIKKKKKNN